MSATRHQAEPGFRPNEFYETLLRIRRDQPRRYASSVSAGMRRRVEDYEAERSRVAGPAVVESARRWQSS